MFPKFAENKLRTIFQFYTNLKLKRARKQIEDKQLPLFELTEKEKVSFLKELTRVAIEINKSVFSDFTKNFNLKEVDIKKEWVKSAFNFMNDNKDFQKLKKIKMERMQEYAKRLDIKIGDSISKTQLKALKNSVNQYKNSKQIRGIISKLESDTFSSEDINKLQKWLTNRNELIARNETGNLYAQEVKDLLIENEMDYYIWRTMSDGRVRDSHRERDGKIFSINDSPLPGEEFNCRCWAEPYKKK